MGKNEHRKEEYMKMNPHGKIPWMKVRRPGYPDVHMCESHAILKYICNRYGLPDHWYPTSE